MLVVGKVLFPGEGEFRGLAGLERETVRLIGAEPLHVVIEHLAFENVDRVAHTQNSHFADSQVAWKRGGALP